MNNYLCFTANTAGSTIKISNNEGTPTLDQNFESSTDGTTWTTVTPDSTIITLSNAGDKAYFRGNNPNGINESARIYYCFVMTGSIAASGNIMSLIDNGACNTLTIPNSMCFNHMFAYCAALTTAPELPATTLTSYCYDDMFRGCTSLTIAPVLPATTLVTDCYSSMFFGCTALTTPPILHAMTLATSCYYSMFWGCTSLVIPPALPATTLADSCYYDMFCDCTSLTTVPELPATTLASYCYYEMFCGCTALIISDTSGTGYDKAWILPTTNSFTNTAYQEDMFYDCAVGAGRSDDSMAGVAGNSYTYYTQNTPIQYKLEVKINYNSNVLSDLIEYTPPTIKYKNTEILINNNSILYLNTKDKYVDDYILVGSTVLNTKDKYLEDYLTITTTNVDWDTNPGTITQLNLDFNWERE